ncbi:hypothetical protein [Sodalinema gerasimenkoae]|uniref:hypothetical protein n=1 Tax=Sodalinema gerasimenkoae TaxID=2862348 RepID=UPI00135AD379|nr:hypothetical protein [Sodalinema gerasimenkoae]
MVEDLSLEQKSTQLLGALVQERGWFSRTEVTGNTFFELDQTTSDNMQDRTQTTNDKLHELSQTASHEVRETSQLTTEDLRGSGRCTNEMTQETAQETQSLGDAPPPVPTLPSSSVPVRGRDAADVTITQAEGRRVRYLVLNQAGSILAAPGEIVTLAIIERAQVDSRERLLLQAVGLM